MLRTVSSISSASASVSASASSSASAASSLLEDHQFLLTRATAKQLKGDIAAAIQLTQQAVDRLLPLLDDVDDDDDDDRDATLRLEVCETRLFLGKLYHLEQRYADAAATFQAARAGFAALVTTTEETDTMTQNQVQTRYYTATTHVASAHQHLGQYDAAERLYQEAFAGHIAISGWSAGMTNHTGYELAQLYKQQQQYDKAIETITDMQTQLAKVLGSTTDPKVLQLNSELANLMVLANTTTTTTTAADTTTTKSNHDEEKEDRTNRTTSSSASQSLTSTTTTKTTTTMKTENKVLAAIELLEDAMEHLPPNSPETMRIFMQIETLKEQHELQQQQHQANGTSSSSSTQDNGVTITVTKGTKAPVVAYSPLSR